ncbi:hypothetical protein PORCRE_1425 [Porphyromonas crevioricanis JCM 15906]|uniref:Uncharacterized protein n=1 Tax=Porphyromonas crevioricanis JCM 15906 TaxID=1305617 RepID=T1CRJ2_9PORP|nr:hypothetical protein PORCRE_1425 [Porphyromonas crevioricanis JCM 15906]
MSFAIFLFSEIEAYRAICPFASFAVLYFVSACFWSCTG